MASAWVVIPLSVPPIPSALEAKTIEGIRCSVAAVAPAIARVLERAAATARRIAA